MTDPAGAMKQKRYCVEARSPNVARLWKARKYGRPTLELSRHYADRVVMKSDCVIIRLGFRGYRQLGKANVAEASGRGMEKSAARLR